MKRWVSHHLELGGYLFLTVGVVLGFYVLNQSRVALCALRDDFDDRIIAQQDSIDRGIRFICPAALRVQFKCHPPREGAFGLTAKELKIQVGAQISTQRRALENSKRTRKALNVVWCRK